jgi:predicted 3-demethylubiquinone-9 3-methyltransferase (glyoxalase superfamily)
MKAITPFLWFDDDLEEAIDFYTSVFPDGKVHGTTRMPDGKVVGADFELAGQRVKGLNGGPMFPHTEAFSFMVECEGQDEVDRYWQALTADGGEESMCGWLKDRFGLSWQIIPVEFLDMVGGGNPEQVQRVMTAMQTMRKMDVAALQAAYDG